MKLAITLWIGDMDSRTFYPSHPLLGSGRDTMSCIDDAWVKCSARLARGEQILGVSCMEKAAMETERLVHSGARA